MEIPDLWWTEGLCSVFAVALQERFGMKIWAIVDRLSDCEDNDWLIHAVGVRDGVAYDANGKIDTPLDQLLTLWDGYEPDEECAQVILVQSSKEHLDRIHDVDLDDTAAAHAYIERHLDLFV